MLWAVLLFIFKLQKTLPFLRQEHTVSMHIAQCGHVVKVLTIYVLCCVKQRHDSGLDLVISGVQMSCQTDCPVFLICLSTLHPLKMHSLDPMQHASCDLNRMSEQIIQQINHFNRFLKNHTDPLITQDHLDGSDATVQTTRPSKTLLTIHNPVK